MTDHNFLYMFIINLYLADATTVKTVEIRQEKSQNRQVESYLRSQYMVYVK